MEHHTASERLPVGVCVYGLPVSCGLMGRDGRFVANPLRADGLIALARTHGLSSIEMPLHGMLPDLEPATIDRLRETLQEADLALVVDSGVVDPPTLEALFPLAARAGARIVRATLSTILEGNRSQIAEGWTAYIAEMRRRIVALRPALESYDLILALEDHQDVTSDDLLMLCEAGGDHVGITFDVANPLAVGEEQLHFVRKIGPWIRNVHLKDYWVYATSSGYRLVRSPLGQGVVPFAELIPLIRSVAPDALHHIELAALYARHIRLFEDDWWREYPPRDVRDVLPALRLVASRMRYDEDWQTPWERGASVEDVQHYEHEQFVASVQYLRTLKQRTEDREQQ